MKLQPGSSEFGKAAKLKNRVFFSLQLRLPTPWFQFASVFDTNSRLEHQLADLTLTSQQVEEVEEVEGECECDRAGLKGGVHISGGKKEKKEKTRDQGLKES